MSYQSIREPFKLRGARANAQPLWRRYDCERKFGMEMSFVQLLKNRKERSFGRTVPVNPHSVWPVPVSTCCPILLKVSLIIPIIYQEADGVLLTKLHSETVVEENIAPEPDPNPKFFWRSRDPST